MSEFPESVERSIGLGAMSYAEAQSIHETLRRGAEFTVEGCYVKWPWYRRLLAWWRGEQPPVARYRVL
jgi:hypothetical protein